LFEASIALTEQVYGADGEPLASARFSYGIYLLGQKDPVAAEQAFRTTAEHPKVSPALLAHAHRYRGIALRDQGRLDPAMESLLHAEQAYLAIGGGLMELQAARAGADRGHALALSGQTQAGIELLRSSLAGIRKERGDKHAELILPRIQLGQALAAHGNVASARVELDAALALSTELLGPEHPRTLAVQEALAALP
jgi:tetratricopeptide (TPR) repeat protein